MKKQLRIRRNARSKIVRTVQIFEAEFGIPTWKRKDPLDELMVTILSQNTNDTNRDRGYNRLRERFPTWVAVRDGRVIDVEEAIRPAGLSKTKSQRMQAILHWIGDTFGGLTLEPLRSMSDDQAIELLTSQKGIGVKTAAVLLAFSLDRDLCPVDTHVHRISQRLGWVKEGLSAENTFHALRPAIPSGKAPTFHLNILKSGRQICKARNPGCEACPLWEDCIWENKSPQNNEK